MTKTEFKKSIIKRINELENQSLLEEIFRLLEIDSDDLGIMPLSDEQKKAISQGQSDIRNGNFLTSKEADKEIDEWLKK